MSTTVAHHRRPDVRTSRTDRVELQPAQDRPHQRDRDRIIASIRDDAAKHHGRISVNRVRRALTGRVLLPQMIGSTYSSLSQSGVITVAGWEVSDNAAGHHRGTVIRTWRLAEGRST